MILKLQKETVAIMNVIDNLLKNNSSLKSFSSNQDIIHEGEALHKDMYVLVSGTVDVYKRYKEPDEIKIASLIKGDLFGEMSLFLNKERTATVVASQDVTVLVISPSDALNLFNEDPKASFDFIQILCSRLESMNISMAESMTLMKEKLTEIESEASETPAVKTEKRIRVQCFGNFDVYVDGALLYFPRKKAKELFAYLIHKRGTSCTIKELVANLLEDREDKIESESINNQIQTFISVMMKVLRGVNAEDAIIKNFNSIAIDIDKVDCDFYRFLQGDPDAKNLYTGEYMSSYSWGETVAGYLDAKII